MEIWKPIPGYTGKYEVSNLGRVRNSNGQILKQHLRSRYLFIGLHDNGKVVSHDVHRLVAEAFCGGKSEDRCEVNHKNLNRLDNRSENLEWVSHLENVRHAFTNGACENHVSKRVKKRIWCAELKRAFDSSYSAAEYLNFTYFRGTKSVPTMARNIRWRAAGHNGRYAYGFHWYDLCSEPSTTIPKGSTPKRVETGGPS